MLDATRDDVTALQEASGSTREDIAQIRGILSQLPAQIADVKDSMRHEIKSAMRVAVMSAGGADPDKTPRGSRNSNASELKLPGGVSWSNPPRSIAWVLLVAVLFAGGAVVGWGALSLVQSAFAAKK
jgi:hypothetical protein